MKKLCVYGKGGIGKSTTVANVAAALAEDGMRVAVVGCDPKADTTRCLAGCKIPTVLDQMAARMPEDIVFIGYHGILCLESGGPEPGTGCAGRGIAAALAEIRSRDLLRNMDVVLYDVLGDVVCGGFSMPLREGIADDVFLVTTSEYMSIYAANNICRGIAKYAQSGNIRLAGVVYNGRSGKDTPETIARFSDAIGTSVVGSIPMSPLISQAEAAHKTVVELFPDSQISQHFRQLAQQMLTGGKRCIPTPIEESEVERLCLA